MMKSSLKVEWASFYNSFSAVTMVETTEGDVPISEIEIGDTVIAYDEDTGETGEYTVTDTIQHEDESIAYVTINGEEIETTPWHLFLTQEGWTEAEDLREGDAIVSLGGVYGTVDSVIIENTVQTMYDLTVEDVHNFAVGDGDWVVHNCWRGETNLPDGNDNGGWQHIEGKHITGTIPHNPNNPDPNTFFPEGTTRAQIENAAQQVVDTGARTSINHSSPVQRFEKRLTVNGFHARYVVIVHTSTGNIITMYPEGRSAR